MNRITLCGSVRFKAQFDAINEEFAVRGINCISLSLWGKGFYGYIDDKSPLKQVLEQIHFDKISLSDAIFVVDTDAITRHVGKSTKQEIDFALAHGKFVHHLSTFVEQTPYSAYPLFSTQTIDHSHDYRVSWKSFDEVFGHPLMLGVMS